VGEHTLTNKNMNEILTEKQEAVLKFIEEYQLSFGKSPTLKEMREHFNVTSDNSILKHLNALIEKGYLEKDDTPRGIKLLNCVKEKLSSAVNKLPLLGFIPAGGPVMTEEYINSWVDVGDIMSNKMDGYFMLTVTGVSMIDAGIFEGDLVMVDSKQKAKNGDIVVALIDNGNTLKRLINKDGKSYLKAENKNYQNLYPVNELVIQGVVKGLIRKY